jgi:(2R)-ethylmalonyl-CoA mutase
MGKIERGEQTVVGVNKWTDGLPSPLVGGPDGGVFQIDRAAIETAIASLETTRAKRDAAKAKAALDRLVAAARAGEPLMELSIECALARVTTGEWAGALRGVWGEYRAATGIAGAQIASDNWDAVRERVNALPRRPKLLVGKPGLDGHSNGAEVIAVAARDAGFEVIYAGIRLEPSAIAAMAVQEDVDVVGLSVLSGSHLELTRSVIEELASRGGSDISVIVGGTIPASDHAALKSLGVARVFTPADYKLIEIVSAIVDLV